MSNSDQNVDPFVDEDYGITRCTYCDTERYFLDTQCSECGLYWDEIKRAQNLVDAIGKALGVDTALISEEHFHAALDAALGEMTQP